MVDISEFSDLRGLHSMPRRCPSVNLPEGKKGRQRTAEHETKRTLACVDEFAPWAESAPF